MLVKPSPLTPWKRNQDLPALFGVLLVGLGLGSAYILRRPDLALNAERFLVFDQGANLFVTDLLNQGRRLYSEIFYQYGPLPAYSYWLFAKVWGNTPLSYLGFLLLTSLASVSLAYVYLRRFVSTRMAFGMSILALLPALVVPGPGVGALSVSSYVPLERVAILLFALSWSSPRCRTHRRAILLGLALVMLQAIKFGGCFFAVAALVAVDGMILFRDRVKSPEIVRYLKLLGLSAAVFLGCETLWAIWLLSSMPIEVAMDTLWPAYMMKAYQGLPSGIRWLRLSGWKSFLGQELTCYLCGVMGLIGAGAWVFGRKTQAVDLRDQGDLLDEGGIFFFLFFYLLASLAYFRHIYHFHQFFWMLIIPSAWLLSRLRPTYQVSVGLLWLPCLLMSFKVTLWNRPPRDGLLLRSKAGETLWAEPQTLREVENLTSMLQRTVPTGAPVLFYSLGAGLHHFFGIPQEGRNYWYMKGVMRPYDEDGFVSSLGHVGAIVYFTEGLRDDAPSQDPCSWPMHPFLPKMCEAFKTSLQKPTQLAEHLWVVKVQPAERATASVQIK